MNELGEFNVPEPFDPDANRAAAYASLRATEVRNLGQHEQDAQVPCGICGTMFIPTRYRKKYCSEECVNEAKRRRWRKQWNERKKKKWAK